jgi:hypothetical protein
MYCECDSPAAEKRTNKVNKGKNVLTPNVESYGMVVWQVSLDSTQGLTGRGFNAQGIIEGVGFQVSG